jgi:hypothetical protein
MRGILAPIQGKEFVVRKRYFSLVVAIGMLVLPAVASADPYGSVAGVSSGGGNGDVTSAGTNAATSSGGGLPFTGLEVGIVLVAGLALLAAGFIMRRRAGAQH